MSLDDLRSYLDDVQVNKLAMGVMRAGHITGFCFTISGDF